jgi:4-hydroxybenzoate polyprenyltransferase
VHSDRLTTTPARLCVVRAGKISEQEVVIQFLVLLAAGVGTAFALDKWAGHEFPTLTVLAVFGSFISYIYSAPPLKLKQSGWIGNYALGSSYIALPWWAGQVGAAAAFAFGVQCTADGSNGSLNMHA